MGHHHAKPGVLCSDQGQGALPDAKALWPSPSSKAGMLLGAQEGCPSFWGIPSSALESGVQQHPGNVRSEFPLEGGKAGMGEGKILVKVCELVLGSGGGVAAATLTCLTAPMGIKAPIPCPWSMDWGLHPSGELRGDVTPSRRGAASPEGAEAVLEWGKIRIGKGRIRLASTPGSRSWNECFGQEVMM